MLRLVRQATRKQMSESVPSRDGDGVGRLITEIAEPAEKASYCAVAVALVEVGGADVAVRDAVAEHEVGGGEHGGSDGDDGFFGAAAGFDAQELGAQVA